MFKLHNAISGEGLYEGLDLSLVKQPVTKPIKRLLMALKKFDGHIYFQQYTPVSLVTLNEP